MTTGTQQDCYTPARHESVNTAVGIAAERATLAARERDLELVRVAARRLAAAAR